MDQDALVDRRIAGGQMLILQLIQDGFDLAAAFWLKAPEDPWAHLVIASSLVDQRGLQEGYRVVQASLQKLPELGFSLAEIKLIGKANAITGSVRKLMQNAAGNGPIRLSGAQIANLLVEDIYIYPLPARPKRSQHNLGKVRLKKAVEQTARLQQRLAPLTAAERRVLEQLAASGISPVEADYWVRKKREEEGHKPPIPAGAVVTAQLVGWWGEKPDDDPNPLLLVEASDGVQGLTFKENTEPV